MSILIKNGLIYDGRGQPPYQKDILIRGNQIASLGYLKKDGADEVIDAKDAWVFPGFIDANSGSDHHLYIFKNPHQNNFLKQGVTTILGGTGGSSLAPLFEHLPETIKKWSAENFHETNTNWQSFKEFLEVIKKKGIGVNFGSFVGYSTIKQALTSNKSQDLTERELKLFKKILRSSLRQGAFGFSTSFECGYSRKAPMREIKELVKIVAEEKKVYVTDLRYPEDDIQKSIDEILEITESTGASVEINHLQPIKSVKNKYRKLKRDLEKKSTKKNINFDCYPYKVTKLPIYRFLPRWIERPTIKEMAEIVRSERNDKEILEHLKTLIRKEITIIHTPKELSFLKGKKIKEVAEKRKLTQAETILNLMKISGLKMVCLYENIDYEALKEFIFSEPVIIASNGIYSEIPEYKPFLKFIKWASSEPKVSLEKAITKITSLPASKFGIEKRGLIKESYAADITIIKNNEITDVIVNGKIALKKGEVQQTLNGKVLKK